MQHKVKRKDGAGFTLVEVIVVLVILAILAAIMIPAMTGWIEKAQEKSAIVGCRACVLAAQTIATEQYATGMVNVTPGEVLDLAEVAGAVSGIEVSDMAAVEHLTYTTPKGVVVTYCRDIGHHPKVYNFMGGVMNGTTLDILKKALEGVSSAKNVDSTGPDFSIGTNGKEQDGLSFKAQMIAYMKEQGYDLPASLLASGDIKTWKVDTEGGSNRILWWSDVDINKATPGDSIRVIRYNESKGTYTAGYMKVVENTVIDKEGNSVTYKKLAGGTNGNDWREADGQNNTTKIDYDATKNIFDTLPEKKP